MLGFFGKIYLFFAGWADQQYLLVVVGLITSVISIYYYIGVIKMMVVKEPQEASEVVKAYPRHPVGHPWPSTPARGPGYLRSDHRDRWNPVQSPLPMG